MSIVGKIHFRDLTRQLELHKVVLSPASDTTVTVWGKVIAYPNLTYWTSASVGFVILLPEDMETGDWTEWYFVYGGQNYYFYQYWIVYDEDTHGQFVFIEGRSPNFSTAQIALDDIPTYNSDAEAAAAGLAVGKTYKAGTGHDRADAGGYTTRLE